MMLNLEKLKQNVNYISKEYPIKKVTLFGSYAEGTYNEDSDVDLLVEFEVPHVSLFMLSGLRIRLNELLGKDVDVLHAPLPDDSLIEIGKEVVLYEA